MDRGSHRRAGPWDTRRRRAHWRRCMRRGRAAGRSSTCHRTTSRRTWLPHLWAPRTACKRHRRSGHRCQGRSRRGRYACRGCTPAGRPQDSRPPAHRMPCRPRRRELLSRHPSHSRRPYQHPAANHCAPRCTHRPRRPSTTPGEPPVYPRALRWSLVSARGHCRQRERFVTDPEWNSDSVPFSPVLAVLVRVGGFGWCGDRRWMWVRAWDRCGCALPSSNT